MMVLCTLLALLTPAHALDLDRLDGATVAALTAQGPLVATEVDGTDRLKSATAAMYLEVAPDRVWSTLSDFASYPSWMPQVEKAEVVSSTSDSTVVDFHLAFDFFLSFGVDYTLRYLRGEGYRMGFDQVKGDFATNRGGWEVRPHGGGSLLYYTAWVDYKSMRALKPILQRQPAIDFGLGTSTVAIVVQAVKRRLEGG